jgi:hypothetical protein
MKYTINSWFGSAAVRCCVVMMIVCGVSNVLRADEESDFYRLESVVTSKAPSQSRSKFWKPAPKGLTLEVSGIAVLDDKRIAVTIRKGEIWLLKNVYGEKAPVTYKRFASALHEPLGLIYKDKSFYTAQRSELTRITDTDGDEEADEYLTVAKGWGTTGNYHEYAFGPKLDGNGDMWLTLNIGMGFKANHQKRIIKDPVLGVGQGRWRGWGMKLDSKGNLIPMCAGMRSPSGIGANKAGDMFYTDQQGNWVGTNSLHHMRKGAFFHHVDALASQSLPGSPISGVKEVPAGLPLPEAVKRMKQLKPPAVWFPYKKVGQSATDIMLDNSKGQFGPFDGQLFVGEFTLASISRVFLEKVDGEYQGACFPFREGFASAVLRMAQGVDGSMFVGLSNRGWSSLGTASYGLQRLVWSGKTPFEIKEMRAKSDGFELVFTKPVDVKTASDPKSYTMSSYTYRYHATYGSDEILTKPLTIKTVKISPDRLRAKLKVDGLREMFVHELAASGIRSADAQQPLLHDRAYYTLNRIPK